MRSVSCCSTSSAVAPGQPEARGLAVEVWTIDRPAKLNAIDATGREFPVEVTITPAKGGAVIAIPREQVEGPWLFVDLPAGIYDVSAMQGDRMQGLKGIKIEPGRQKSVLLRWPEERGAGFKAPKE